MACPGRLGFSFLVEDLVGSNSENEGGDHDDPDFDGVWGDGWHPQEEEQGPSQDSDLDFAPAGASSSKPSAVPRRRCGFLFRKGDRVLLCGPAGCLARWGGWEVYKPGNWHYEEEEVVPGWSLWRYRLDVPEKELRPSAGEDL